LKEIERQGLREGASLEEVVCDNIALEANLNYKSHHTEKIKI